jgi:hypothetical protein
VWRNLRMKREKKLKKKGNQLRYFLKKNFKWSTLRKIGLKKKLIISINKQCSTIGIKQWFSVWTVGGSFSNSRIWNTRKTAFSLMAKTKTSQLKKNQREIHSHTKALTQSIKNRAP